MSVLTVSLLHQHMHLAFNSIFLDASPHTGMGMVNPPANNNLFQVLLTSQLTAKAVNGRLILF